MNNKEEQDNALTFIIVLFGVVFLIPFLIFYSLAVHNIGSEIGYKSAVKLSMCHPALTDVQCIGYEKAEIVADYYDDEKETHGISFPLFERGALNEPTN